MSTPLPEAVILGPETCNDPYQAQRREWWLANGLGAYAGGTVDGTLTRRYHGLLVAPVQPPLGRMLLVAKADATVIDGEQRFPLFANRWAGGVMDPPRPAPIASFRLDGRMPVWTFEAGGAIVEQRIWMEHGANTTCVAFRRRNAGIGRVRLVLLVDARDHHHAGDANRLHPALHLNGTTLTVLFEDVPPLRLMLPEDAAIELRRDPYYGFELSVERERGLPERDDHLCVGIAEFALGTDAWTGLVASIESDAEPGLDAALERARARDASLLATAHAANPALRGAPPWIDQLVLAADSFVVTRAVGSGTTGRSVIAGYPWFGDWGRDTMIALPGLALATGRPDVAHEILETFAGFIEHGLLPNVFPGRGETPAYITADASLWYIEAWRAWFEATRDRSVLRRVFPRLEGIVDAHLRGTLHGIAHDPQDGLLRAGEPGVQLTWMDAKVGSWVVTPRIGKPVEINALWFNAMMAMTEFARTLRRPLTRYKRLAAQCRDGFARFADAEHGGLVDVLDGPEGDERRLRPNQILAVSLRHSPLDAARQASVVERVERELLTPFGLRTLAPADPDYRPRYEGGVWERDGAYHQGTVWAWLLGHFAIAEARVRGDAAAARSRLDAMAAHLHDAGLGTISEIFDAQAPHESRGCPAQAWSVACTLQAWCALAPPARDPNPGEGPPR